MMATSVIDDLWTNADKMDWFKGVRVMEITDEAIRPFVETEITKFHYDIRSNFRHGSICGRCRSTNASHCSSRICSDITSLIELVHRYSPPCYKNSDITQWLSDPWEIAKCYMSRSKDLEGMPESDIDFPSVLNVVINNTRFQRLITAVDMTNSNNIFCKVRDTPLSITAEDIIKLKEQAARYQGLAEVAIEELKKKWTEEIKKVTGKSLIPSFIDGIKESLCRLTTEHIQRQKPKRTSTDDWTVEKFLSIMEVLPQQKDLSESHREMLFPSSGSHLELAQWDIYLYCFVLNIELHQPLDNRTLLFMKDAKTLRDKLLANPSEVEKSELSNLCCDYLDNPLKDDMLRIFESERTFADMMHANIVLQSWRRDEDKDTEASYRRSNSEKDTLLFKVIQSLHTRQSQIEKDIASARKDSVEISDDVATGKAIGSYETVAELKPYNAPQTDIEDLQKMMTSPDQNNCVLKRNGATDYFSKKTGCAIDEYVKGSIILKVFCPSMETLFGFWKGCTDGTVVEAMSKIRDAYREHLGCDTLEFDIVLKKKEVTRCTNIIIGDLNSRLERLEKQTADVDEPISKPGIPVEDQVEIPSIPHVTEGEQHVGGEEHTPLIRIASHMEVSSDEDDVKPKSWIDEEIETDISGMAPSTSSYDEHSSVVEHVMIDHQDPEPMKKRFKSFHETEYETAREMKVSNLKELNIKPEQFKSVLVEENMDEKNEKVVYPRQKVAVSRNSSDEESSEEEDGEFNRQQDSSELILKDYQLELAENAVAGKNTLICAGTGTVNTWVALYVVKEHLNRAFQGNRKVVFMARTSTLIKQQVDRFKKYLPQFKTKLITGENEESSNIGMFLQYNDILCLTPSILANSLDSGSVISLEELSLIILDDCHHTKNDEPYNNLMRKYLLEKMAKGKRDLPQMIGLTASIGVGKSHSDEDALDYMLHLFASLDVRDLSTVRRCTAMYEQVHATEELITMTNPIYDPCKDILLEAIDETEDRLKEIALWIPGMLEMVAEKCPGNKQSQEFDKWTVEVEKMAMHNVSDDETARNIRTCAIYLNEYNAALEVNTLLGSVDVMMFLANKHKQESLKDNQKNLTDEERKLLVNLQSVQKKLALHCKTKNQNVRNLCDILKGMMRQNIQDSRAIVFVKARATCIALAAFLKKDFKGLGIDVQCLYGNENRGGEDGMTESVQNETVEKFQKGFCKILVATIIGIEGIDVPDCNIVLNYNYLGNEIIKTQIKGRSRKMEGYNAYKLAMMQRALKLFRKMDPKLIETKITLYQQEEMNKFRMRKEVEKIKSRRKRTEDDFEIRCRRCNVLACCTSDILMVKCQYIVIDESFKDRIDIKPHKRPIVYDGFHKKFKMYCKMCPSEWGIVSENKGLMCRILKLESFKLYNTKTRNVTQYRKWKDIPTRILEVEFEDLTRILGQVHQDETLTK